jgi:hypothetical protein
LASVIAIIDPIFNQVEVHLRRDDAPVVGRYFQRYAVHETLQLFLLFIHKVFQCVEKFCLFFWHKNLHCFGNRLNLITSKLDVPEADSLAVVFADLNSLSLGRPSRSVLGHLSDTAYATSSLVKLHALDVTPKRVGVQSRLQRAVVRYNSHGLYNILLFQEDLESFVDNSSLKCLPVKFVLFIEDGLVNQEVRQRVWEDVYLELYLIARICTTTLTFDHH